MAGAQSARRERRLANARAACQRSGGDPCPATSEVQNHGGIPPVTPAPRRLSATKAKKDSQKALALRVAWTAILFRFGRQNRDAAPSASGEACALRPVGGPSLAFASRPNRLPVRSPLFRRSAARRPAALECGRPAGLPSASVRRSSGPTRWEPRASRASARTGAAAERPAAGKCGGASVRGGRGILCGDWGSCFFMFAFMTPISSMVLARTGVLLGIADRAALSAHNPGLAKIPAEGILLAAFDLAARYLLFHRAPFFGGFLGRNYGSRN